MSVHSVFVSVYSFLANDVVRLPVTSVSISTVTCLVMHVRTYGYIVPHILFKKYFFSLEGHNPRNIA